jgi:predicted RNA-binding protein with PIN domain
MQELVDRCRSWAGTHGHRAIVVFDGRAPGGLVGEEERDSAYAVVGTGAESADDWIARRATELAATGRPYWLITSDRELRRRAGGSALRQLGGGSFLEWLGVPASFRR